VIAYLTDVEGRWDKLVSFADGNPHVSLVDDALVLADGVTFVFGGDAIDRGPSGRKIVRTLLAARSKYGDRVVLLAGNRDINKLRLRRELDVPGPRGDLLRKIFETTMGAPRAFAHRATELAAEGRSNDDEAVVESYLDDLHGDLQQYLSRAQLAYRSGATLFVHGGVTIENFVASDVDTWIEELGHFYDDQIIVFGRGGSPADLIAYQAPIKGTHLNQASVVYARPTDEHGNPELPDASVIKKLRDSGIERVVVGHTPSGDCPAIVRDDGFELVLGDNSYGRIELGSQLAFTDAVTTVHGVTELDDGTHVRVAYSTERKDRTPLGRRDAASGQLVKAVLAGDAYLLFRALEDRRVEQVSIAAAEVRARTFVTAR
jgi:Calcineurin-like phosphoesterase